MTGLVFLIPAALFLGLLGLGAFFWSVKSGQFDDLDGSSMRILIDDEDEPSCPSEAEDIKKGAGEDRPPKDASREE